MDSRERVLPLGHREPDRVPFDPADDHRIHERARAAPPPRPRAPGCGSTSLHLMAVEDDLRDRLR
jgi:hypothetical protein